MNVVREPLRDCAIVPHAEALIAATGADFRIGGDEAFYVPSQDFIRIPHQTSYTDQINYYRTAFHELGHWTGHELGHWRNHRGQCLVCRADDFNPAQPLGPEQVANSYAADLLLPKYIFQPIARQFGKLNFKTVSALSDIFETSKTATALRLITHDHAPAILVCHGRNGRKWFARAPSVPLKWFPQSDLMLIVLP